MMKNIHNKPFTLIFVLWAILGLVCECSSPEQLDFWVEKHQFLEKFVNFSEILSSGPPKDGIPLIDNLKFVDFADERAEKIEDRAPVIGVIINGKAGGRIHWLF